MKQRHESATRCRQQVFEALRALMTPPDPPKRPIGFVVPKDNSGGFRHSDGTNQLGDLAPGAYVDPTNYHR